MKLLTILTLACVGFGLSAQEAETKAGGQTKHKWVLAKNKKGVKVYTRKVDGVSFKEFKAITAIKTSLTSLVALVGDIEAGPKWIDTCTKGKLLKRESPSKTYTYSYNSAPWPVQNRDAVVYNEVSQDPKTLVVTIKITGKPDYIKKKKKVTRVKRLEGFWRFTPREDGSVEVHYQVLSDPGGSIPAWLVNSAAAGQPFKTLSNMKTFVKTDKYQDARLDFIKEPATDK